MIRSFLSSALGFDPLFRDAVDPFVGAYALVLPADINTSYIRALMNYLASIGCSNIRHVSRFQYEYSIGGVAKPCILHNVLLFRSPNRKLTRGAAVPVELQTQVWNVVVEDHGNFMTAYA